MRLIKIAVMGILLSACQTYYEPPAEGTPTATLMFNMSYDNGFALGTSRSQEYRFVDGVSYCEKPALMAGPLNKNKDGQSIPAGKKLTISSQAFAFTGTGNGLIQGSCVNLSSFTPEEGKVYKISQTTTEGIGCTVDVKEISSGNSPSDFYVFSRKEMDDITETCSQK